MPFPTLKSGRVDVPLTNVLLAYKNEDFIAEQILPALPVKKESDLIGALGNSHLRTYSSKRSLYDEGEHRMEFSYTKDDSYQIEFYDLEVYLPDRLIENCENPFDPRRDAGEVALQSLKLERELALAAAMRNTAIMTNYVTLSGTDKFSDLVNSDPVAVIETGRTSIYSKTGKEANSMVIGRGVFNTLKRHPAFLEQVKGIKVLSGEALIQLMKDTFEVENIYIGKGIQITTVEGQTETFDKVWGNDIQLFYKPSRSTMYEPSFGYQFTLPKNLQADVRRHTNDLGDIVRVYQAYQDKILDTNCAYLIKDAI